MLSTFATKLGRLNHTQQSIETLSQWTLFHSEHAAELVSEWNRHFLFVEAPKKLVFLYLANDIVQNSRNEPHTFIAQFSHVMPAALSALLSSPDCSPDVSKRVQRLVSV